MSFGPGIDLKEIESNCWKELIRAVDDRNSGWRLPALATSSLRHSLRQRVVVLRAVDVERRQLCFHTDVRSPKVSAIRESSDVSLLFYDAAGIQLVAEGFGAVHVDDDVADRVWKNETPASLKGYSGQYAPGTKMPRVEHNLPAELLNVIPDRAAIESGRANFAVIVVSIRSFDWLCLDRAGNRRALFEYDERDCVSQSWLAP